MKKDPSWTPEDGPHYCLFKCVHFKSVVNLIGAHNLSMHLNRRRETCVSTIKEIFNTGRCLFSSSLFPRVRVIKQGEEQQYR